MSSPVSSRSRSGLVSGGAQLQASSGTARARAQAVDAVARVLAINAAGAAADVDPQGHPDRDDARLYLPPRQSRRNEAPEGPQTSAPAQAAEAAPPHGVPAQQGLSAYERASHGPRKGLKFIA